MAALTWREVSAPSFSGVAESQRLAATLLRDGLSNLSEGIGDYQKQQVDADSREYMNRISSYRTPEELQAARQSGALTQGLNTRNISEAAFKFGTARDQEMLANSNTRQLMDIRGYGYNRLQQQDAISDNQRAARQALEPDLLAAVSAARSGDRTAFDNFINTRGRDLTAAGIDPLKTLETGNVAYNTGMSDRERKINHDNFLHTTSNTKTSRGVIEAVYGNPNFRSKDEALAGLQAIRGSMDPQAWNEAYASIEQSKAWDEQDVDIRNIERNLGIPSPNRAPTDNSWAAGIPGIRSNALMGLVDRTEGAGNYDTLYAHSQRPGRAFDGVRVSRMTIGQLNNMSKEYGPWVKNQLAKSGQNARIATPMGRFQIVNTTLQNAAKEMGLSPDTLFDENTQIAIFDHLVQKRLSGPQTLESKLRGLRQEWEGFKNVSDQELTQAIQAYESGDNSAIAQIFQGRGYNNTDSASDLLGQSVMSSLDRNQAPQTNNAQSLLDQFGGQEAAEPDGMTVNLSEDAASRQEQQQARINELRQQQGMDELIESSANNAPNPLQSFPEEPITQRPEQPAEQLMSAVTPEALRAMQQSAQDTSAAQQASSAMDAAMRARLAPRQDSQEGFSVQLPGRSRVMEIGGVEESGSQFTNQGQANKRKRDVNEAVKAIAEQVSNGIGDGPGGSAWNRTFGGMRDYFTADQETQATNEAARENARVANDWWSSNEARTHFQANPQELVRASADPINYAAQMIGEAVSGSAERARDEAASQAAAGQQEAPQTQDAGTVAAATSMDGAIRAFEAGRRMEYGSELRGAVQNVLKDPEERNKSVFEVAKELKDLGASDYSAKDLAAEIGKLSNEFQLSPSVIGAFIKSTHNNDGLIFSDSFTQIKEKISEFAKPIPGEKSNTNKGVRILENVLRLEENDAQFSNIQEEWSHAKNVFSNAIQKTMDPAQREDLTRRYKAAEKAYITMLDNLNKNRKSGG